MDQRLTSGILAAMRDEHLRRGWNLAALDTVRMEGEPPPPPAPAPVPAPAPAPPPPPAPAPAPTPPAADLEAIRAEAVKAERQRIEAELGRPLDQAKQIVAGTLSDLERQANDAKAAKEAADAALVAAHATETAAALTVRTALVRAALVEHGVPRTVELPGENGAAAETVDNLALVARMVDVPEGADESAVAAAVERLLKLQPALGAPAETPGAGAVRRPVPGDPGRGPRPLPPASASIDKGRERARAGAPDTGGFLGPLTPLGQSAAASN